MSHFGAKTYEGDYASIFFEYWRSFLAVESLVLRFGDLPAVFRSYWEWDAKGREQTLEDIIQKPFAVMGKLMPQNRENAVFIDGALIEGPDLCRSGTGQAVQLAI